MENILGGSIGYGKNIQDKMAIYKYYSYPNYTFDTKEKFVEQLYNDILAEVGKGKLTNIQARHNTSYIGFIQTYSELYGTVFLAGYGTENLIYSRLSNGTWIHKLIS